MKKKKSKTPKVSQLNSSDRLTLVIPNSHLNSEPDFNAIHQQKIAETYFASKDYAAAIAACKQAIQLFPNFAIAYKTLGNSYLGQGDIAAATNAYKIAIQLDPNLAEPYANLGNIATQAGQLNEAINFYQKAIALKPNLAGAHWMLGNALLNQEQIQLAFNAYNRALEVQPQLLTVEDLIRQSESFLSQGHLEQAARFYSHVIKLQPNLAQAYSQLGVIFLQLGELDRSETYLRQAIQLQPNFADAYANLGAVLGRLDRVDEAIATLTTAIQLNPQTSENFCNLGMALAQKGRYAEAINSLETAIRQSPNHAQALYLMGNIYNLMGNLSEAKKYAEMALSIQSDYMDAYALLSSVLFEQGHLIESETIARKAIALQPDYADAYCNLGASLSEQSRLTEAIAIYTKAIELCPDDATTHLNLGMTLLTTGNFSQGWREYEWRWQTPDVAHLVSKFTQPRWDGSDCKGKTLFVWAEQGLGDSLQFIRYLPMVAELCDRIILGCSPSLVRLFSQFKNITQIVTDKEPLPQFDLHIPLLSLPSVFQTDLPTIPAMVPYLQTVQGISPHQISSDASAALKIGFVWTSGYRAKPKFLKVQHLKSCSIDFFMQLLEIPRVHLYSLQVGVESQQIQPYLGERVHDLSPYIQDFADTASLIDQLDLIISVDTAVAHLAGAMAKPTWIILPYAADWRWLLERSDSPWYPTARLLRQSQSHDWQTVFTRIRQALV